MLIPGILHTAEYATAVMRRVIDFYEIPDDLNAGVAARMQRQQALYQGDHRYHFILAEQALRTVVGDTDVMVGQLDRLLAAMFLPRVMLGIIPSGSEYRAPSISSSRSITDTSTSRPSPLNWPSANPERSPSTPRHSPSSPPKPSTAHAKLLRVITCKNVVIAIDASTMTVEADFEHHIERAAQDSISHLRSSKNQTLTCAECSNVKFALFVQLFYSQ